MEKTKQNIDVKQEILDTAQVLMSQKGFSAVGLNEILTAASVPKGSFYHYFKSKEAFGEALLQRYFDEYLASMEELFGKADLNGAEKLMIYFGDWVITQVALDPKCKCLVVKLAAEVADLSEGMRAILLRGTGQIVTQLTHVVKGGIADGSLAIDVEPAELAETLYQTWLGASLLAKITKDDVPLKRAMNATKIQFGINK